MGREGRGEQSTTVVTCVVLWRAGAGGGRAGALSVCVRSPCPWLGLGVHAPVGEGGEWPAHGNSWPLPLPLYLQVAKRQTGLVLRRRYSFLQLLLDPSPAPPCLPPRPPQPIPPPRFCGYHPDCHAPDGPVVLRRCCSCPPAPCAVRPSPIVSLSAVAPQVAKRQTGLVLRRRYSFLQLLLDSVGAHHAALRSGSEMLGRLTPLGDAARGVVAEAKEAEKDVQVCGT